MPRHITLTLFFLFSFSALLHCAAQDLNAVHEAVNDPDTTKLWRVEVNDGNLFVGKIRDVGSGAMTLETGKFGPIRISLADVRTIEEVKRNKVVAGSEDNFHSTHHLLFSNGFGLKKGEAYYQNVWVLFNQFNIGVSKNFSLGLGTFPIYLFGAKTLPFWVAPKVSLPLGPKANIAVGAIYLQLFNVDGERSGDGGGIVYSSLTLGNRDRNVSIGLGYGFSGEQFARRPVFTLSNITRVGPRAYFITENFLFITEGNSFGVLSAGGRRLINRAAIDFGGFVPLSGKLERFIVGPWLGLSVPLGKRHPVE